MPTLHGPNSSLILISDAITSNDRGIYTLTRQYACATSYAPSAGFAIDSEPIDFTPPAGFANPLCVNVNRVDGEGGITRFSVEYAGLTNAAYGITYGTAILSYSKAVVTGSGETAKTDNYTGTYAAPTATRSFISASGSFVPSTPSSGFDIRVLTSYKNGQASSPPSFTKQWVISNLSSTKVGTYYLIEATGTHMIVG